mmetsp:Transcript_41160/g.132480  ORF Transcript_41160/g.132480 Transcript_41160/m.132480 type:complete len:801 (+) Transcript_41160:87-2489(+)
MAPALAGAASAGRGIVRLSPIAVAAARTAVLGGPLQGLRRFLSVALAIGAVPLLRELYRCWAWYLWRARRQYLQLTSPLEAAAVKLARPRGGERALWRLLFSPWESLPDCWRGFCPCCKRPVDLKLSEPWTAHPPRPDARGRFAFVINLWGASPAYVLGAMVLGYSIQKTGTKHSLICLHTEDVPKPFLRLLSLIWECRQVEHVDVVDGLSVEDQCERFEKVFTKLRGMQLTDFAKILVMDIDLLVRSNIDELFELQAPAAMKRGMNDSRWPMKHGDPIDARCFFLGKDPTKWSWSVGTGINAGTMLWQPDKLVFNEMMEELSEPNHPEHMRGNGPEQDYLSRFWADSWSYIGVEYNFQLHQMFFAIHPSRAHRAERTALLQTPEKIKIVHYSGVSAAKPWHRLLDERWADFWPDRSLDMEYEDLYAEEFQGYWLWVRRDPATFENSSKSSKNWDLKGMYVAEDGEIYRKPDWDDKKSWENGGGAHQHVKVPEAASQGAMNFLRAVLKEWFDTLEELEQKLGMDIQAAVRGAAAAAAVAAGLSSPSGALFCSGSTGGADSLETSVPRPATAQPRLPAQEGASQPAVGDRPGFAKQFEWNRPSGGWWCEQATRGVGTDDVASKVTVICGRPAGRGFVQFLEAGEEVFEESGFRLAGAFVKVAGPHSARHFKLPAVGLEGFSEEELQHMLAPIHFWVKGVPPGGLVLFALLDIAPDAMPHVLEALAPLGVPQVPPPRDMRALAAVGWCAGSSESLGEAGAAGPRPADRAFTTHAAADVAYASMPRAIVAAEAAAATGVVAPV